MPTKWYDATVFAVEDLSPNVRLFRLKIENEGRFEFLPGQFITLDLPVGDKRLQRWRSYSIANISNDENILELCIAKMQDGLATTYLFEHTEVGRIIKFKGPEGNFVLPNDLDDKKLVLICTGTGIAPFISMIRGIIAAETKVKSIHLIFGARKKEDILYFDELSTLSPDYFSFSYDIALSREEDWAGYKGYVHQVYMKDDGNSDDENTHYLICGWTKMIDEAVANLLLKLKVDKSRIHYELYG